MVIAKKKNIKEALPFGRASFFTSGSCYPLALMVKALKSIPTLAVLLIAFSAFTARGAEYYMHGLGGGGNYIEESSHWSGVVAGLEGGIQASDELGFEIILQHMSVDTKDYYFTTIGARYRFPKVDFFMEPSVDFRTGVLIPLGKKVDGIVGVGVGLLYRTHNNFEFGPKIEPVLIFAGPHKNIFLSYTAVVGYRF